MADLINRLHHHANGDCDMTPVGSTLLEAADRIEELEAKLTKAVEALRNILSNDDLYPWRIAREVLAELEGK